MSERNRTSARRTRQETADCQARAWQLKVYGAMTFDAIAKTPDPTGKSDSLYANASAARAAYLAHDARMRGGDTTPVTQAERRNLMDDRYERIVQSLLPKALQGNGEAADRVLRALAQQAQLHGLNTRPAAPPIEDVKGGDPADELAERRRRAQEAAAAAVRDATSAAPPAPTST